MMLFRRATPDPLSATDAADPGDDLGDVPPSALPSPFWAKITGNAAGTNLYSWEQVDEGDVPTFDALLADEFTGTGDSTSAGAPAYEVNGRTDVPTGTRVRLWPAGDLSYWLFAAPDVGGGSGDVVGPSSSTDDAIALFDGTTGKLLQNSTATIINSGGTTKATLTGTTGQVQLGTSGILLSGSGSGLDVTDTSGLYTLTVTANEFYALTGFRAGGGGGTAGVTGSRAGLTFTGGILTGGTFDGRDSGGFTAAGTTLGTATAITSDVATVSGADGTKGVKLPDKAGGIVVVTNTAGSTLKVYPHNSGSVIGVGGLGAADSLAGSTTRVYWRIDSTTWKTQTL